MFTNDQYISTAPSTALTFSLAFTHTQHSVSCQDQSLLGTTCQEDCNQQLCVSSLAQCLLCCIDDILCGWELPKCGLWVHVGNATLSCLHHQQPPKDGCFTVDIAVFHIAPEQQVSTHSSSHTVTYVWCNDAILAQHYTQLACLLSSCTH